MVKKWKEFRQEITRLYIQEAMTLSDVQKYMDDQYDFQASCVLSSIPLFSQFLVFCLYHIPLSFPDLPFHLLMPSAERLTIINGTL